MRYLLAALIACMTLGYAPAATFAAEGGPDSALRRLAADGGGSLEVRWDETAGTPSLIAGKLTKPSKHSPAWIASEFMRKTKKLYGLQSPHSSMEITSIRELPNATVQVRMQHMLYGTPVWGDELRIAIDADGVIRRAEGRVRAGLAKATLNRAKHAAISPKEAVRTAGSAVDLKRMIPGRTEVRSYYLPARAGIPLIYVVTFYDGDAASFPVAVHALTGRILTI